MRCFCSMVLLFALAFPVAAQESLVDRLARVEASTANINTIMATQARLQSDVRDVKEELQGLKEEVKALSNALLPGRRFVASTQDEWGRGNVATFNPTAAWGGVQQLESPSACAGGQCGVGVNSNRTVFSRLLRR